jgi:O-antigen/teichoic acid export membrane protein
VARAHVSGTAVRTISRNAGYLAVAQTANFVVRIVWIVAAARILGPDLYAVLAYSQTWQLAFLPLALFGVGAALSYLIGPDRSLASTYAGHALAIRLVTTVVASIACIALSRWITPDPRVPVLIAVLSLALCARALTAMTQTLFTAFEINQYSMRQDLAFSVLHLAAGIGVLLSGAGLLLLVSTWAVVAWMQTAWAFHVARRLALPVRFDWRPAEWGPLLRLAVPALLITLATDWSFNGTMILYRNLTDDGVLFGQFALAMQALSLAAIVPLAISRAAFPALRRAVARADDKDLRFASVMQRAAPVLGTAAGLTGLACGEPAARWLLGAPFSTAGELAGLTLWCSIPLMAATGYPEILLARGRFRAMVLLTLGGAGVMTLATLLLVPLFGVTGTIVAAFLGFSVPPAGAFAVAWRGRLADPVGDLARPFGAAIFGVGAFLIVSAASDAAALPAGLLALAVAAGALRVVRPGELREIRGAASSG